MLSSASGGKPLYVALAQRKEDRKAHLQAQYMQRVSTGIRMQVCFSIMYSIEKMTTWVIHEFRMFKLLWVEVNK